jgi:hypothetical protein
MRTLTDLDWRGYLWMAWVAAGLTLLGAVIAFAQANWAGAATMSAAFLVALGVILLAPRWSALISLLFVVALMLNAAGYAWHLFATPGPFDEIVHAFTIFSITLWLGLDIYAPRITELLQHGLLFTLTLLAVGMAIGAVWEIAEYLIDGIAGVNVLNSYNDTIIDLGMDGTGAGFAAVLCLWLVRQGGSRRVPAP